MTQTVTVEEAQEKIAQLLKQVMNDSNEILILESERPVARLVGGGPSATQRSPGSAKGKITMPPDFNDPLPDEIIGSFYK